ncbi:MAG TPA: stage IV sporulation protein A [Candidatus Scatomorpha intestinavium]|uniref:Stage IV sporulation protein A n=1 Tax=Candidatus Scatomorpha intestinavium TaxID=2840922 RepID=A0A9D1CT54_9FIRM|nr:stage IV sporulation protein A [Candidatus Scatomorpha intestinavium]
MNTSIYQDMAARTGGDIYIGLVGPVRTGKSTFIKRFMETLVIPNIADAYARERAKDELPQSGSGRTIMTAEPKFVPEDAAKVELEGGVTFSVRLIDCVGYMVQGAAGQLEEGEERMVTTPWFDHEVSLSEAAEEGTRRVIAEHSTLGIVMTTDGSICGIPRENYVEAEERVINELRAIGKPFVLLLNCASPQSEEAEALRQELSEKYAVTCLAVSCVDLGQKDIEEILKFALYEFPIAELGIFLPPWLDALPQDAALKTGLYEGIASAAAQMGRVRDAFSIMDELGMREDVSAAGVKRVEMGTGQVTAEIDMPRSLYYKTISEQSGFDIADDGDLMTLLTHMREIKTDYDHISDALRSVRETGYGVVMPLPGELKLEEPQIVRTGGRYSVRLKASAPSIHMMMTNIETEVTPALGGEKASEEIMGFLLQGFDGDVSRIWESNIFGKSLYDIAEEGLESKIKRVPAPVRNKLRNTMQRIVNEGSGSLICIVF